MEFLIEFVAELALELAVELLADRKVAHPLRLALAIALAALCAGLIGLCFFFAWRERSWPLAALGVLALGLILPVGRRAYGMYRQGKK